jgi:hypothetical protein
MGVGLASALVAAMFAGCGHDETPFTTSSSTTSRGQGGSGGGGVAPICGKYGGTAGVASIVRDGILPTVAADCRVNAFFASLSANQMTHLSDCLVIQVQELFGCAGIMYAGSMDSLGGTCRDMQVAHAGLAINQGDYDAFLDDVVSGLAASNVEADDISTVADALLGFDSSIVEDADTTDPSQDMCMGVGGAGGGGGAGGAGGN